MLKFHSNSTTFISDFEEFFIFIYVLVDDLYQRYVPDSVSRRRNIDHSKTTDSEIITISLCGEIAGIDSQNAWYAFVKKNYGFLFPTLCSRTRFHRRHKALLQVMELLREKALCLFQIESDSFGIADSFPLPICKFARAPFHRTFLSDGVSLDATYGYCASKKETYFGYKVHALITFDGVIKTFELTSASVDDRKALLDLVENQGMLVILGDKGYVSQSLKETLAKEGITLLALPRSNSKEPFPSSIRKMIVKQRRKIETVFSQLNDQFHIEHVLAKSFYGLCSRLVTKIFGYNLCLLLNSMFSATAEISKIKQLIY